jgi:hypothetical protein
MTVPLVLFFVLPHAGERDLGFALHQLSFVARSTAQHVHLTESCRRVPSAKTTLCGTPSTARTVEVRRTDCMLSCSDVPCET